jgi:hypothetical protein
MLLYRVPLFFKPSPRFLGALTVYLRIFLCMPSSSPSIAIDPIPEAPVQVSL